MDRSPARIRLTRRLCVIGLSVTAAAGLGTAQLLLTPNANAIVGGAEAGTSAHPWMVQVDNGRPIGCGGTLVAATKVVTAAHCIPKGASASTFTVIAGEDKYHGAGGTRVKVDRLWVHPAANPKPGAARVDLAVLTLAQPLAQSTLPIAGPADAGLYSPGRQGTALGWGADSEDGAPPSATLRQVSIPVKPVDDCLEFLTPDDQRAISLTKGSLFCAGGGGKGVGLGDSGGPLVIDGKLAGVVSGGLSSDFGREPALFTRVGNFSADLECQLDADTPS